MIYVPPFDDYEVLCGQGTIGLEILEDVPNVTDVVVPLGGGGLGAGVALHQDVQAGSARDRRDSGG